MTLDYFHTVNLGKAVTYDNNPENYGQCAQLMERKMFDVDGVTPPIYPGAADYYERGVPGYTKIAKTTELPKKGDLVYFQRSVDSVGNNGHVDICMVDGAASGYTGFDSNWDATTYFQIINGVKYPAAHDVVHNYDLVTGYLRKEVPMPPDYLMNSGDVDNGFAIFKKTPTQADKDAWIGQPFKKFMYDKIVPEVAAMPSANVKPYSGPPLFLET